MNISKQIILIVAVSALTTLVIAYLPNYLIDIEPSDNNLIQLNQPIMIDSQPPIKISATQQAENQARYLEIDSLKVDIENMRTASIHPDISVEKRDFYLSEVVRLEAELAELTQ